MPSGYAFQKIKENIVRASGRGLPISTKHSVEIANYVRGRPLKQAKHLIELAIKMERPIPIKIYTNGPGHKAGIASGRYHVKACEHIMKVLASAEANAKFKGLNVADLKLIHIAAQQASQNWHHGRQKRSVFKNTHIEIVLEEVKGQSKPKSESKKPKTQEKKISSEKKAE